MSEYKGSSVLMSFKLCYLSLKIRKVCDAERLESSVENQVHPVGGLETIKQELRKTLGKNYTNSKFVANVLITTRYSIKEFILK